MEEKLGESSNQINFLENEQSCIIYAHDNFFILKVLNSIDAQARNIAVRIDLDLYKAEVIDNGIGISHEDLKLIGSRYVTSKCKTVSDIEQGRLDYHG